MGLPRERFGGQTLGQGVERNDGPVENASGRAFGERQAQGLAAVREIIGAGGQGEALDEGDPRAVAPEGAHGRGERGEAQLVQRRRHLHWGAEVHGKIAAVLQGEFRGRAHDVLGLSLIHIRCV